MTIPFLILLLGFFGVLAYFARRNITWTSKTGTGGSIGSAFVVFLIFAGIGWGLDVYLHWSTIPQYMFAVGGSLGAISIAFFGAFGLLCISMFVAAGKVGTMVA